MSNRKEKEKLKKFSASETWCDIEYEKYFGNEVSFEQLGDNLHPFFLSNVSNKSNHKQILNNLIQQREDELVLAIRRNHAFLGEQFLPILRELKFSEEYQKELKIWEWLHHQELEIWNKLDAELDTLKNKHFPQVLSDLVIWMENENSIQSQSEDFNPETIAKVYSFFTEVFMNHADKKVDLSENEMHLAFRTSWKQKEHIVGECCELIKTWLDFLSNMIYQYCYDDTFKLDTNFKQVELEKYKVNLKKWNQDGVRYKINELEYEETARICLELGRESMNDSKGKEAVKYIKRSLLLQDTFLIGNENDSSKVIQNFSVILSDISSNLNAPKKALSENFKHYIIHNPSSEAKSLERNDDYLSQSEFKTAFNKYSKKVREKGKSSTYFNRFNRDYHFDVMMTPFLKINQMYFCPSIFFRDVDWFYNLTQKGILDLNYNGDARRTTSQAMEISLAKKFENQGWKTKVYSQKEANHIDGDVDITVEDDQSSLYIQLKRTKLRLNLKQYYEESIQSETDGAIQVSRAYESLKNETKSQKKETLWLVSTSYENIGRLADLDVYKANYYDVLMALRTPKFKSLKEFIDFIQNDEHLKKWRNIYFDEKEPDELKQKIFMSGLLQHFQ